VQKSRRKFSKEFKENAVRLWRTSGESSDYVAKQLDIDGSRLRHWASAIATHGPNSFPGVGKRHRMKSDLEEEVWQLKKKLEKVEEERDILKKAWDFFSSHLNNPTR
jgi:transposase